MRLKTYINSTFLILGILLSRNLSAQETSTFFTNLSVRDGLSSNIIACIEQDQYDFIWIGTGSGLSRFDGSQFLTFKKEASPNSLPSNELSTLLADGDYLWVGTWHGLCRLNLKTFEIQRIDLGGDIAVRALSKSENSLWVGTNSGLIQYHLKDQSFTKYSSQENLLSHNTVRTIYEDSLSNLWVGTYDGLNLLPQGESKFIKIDLPRTDSNGPSNLLILDIKTSNKKLWIGTEVGLFELNQEVNTTKKIEAEFSNNVIKCIYEDKLGKLWLGTDFGLNIFDPNSNQVATQFHNPKLSFSIANNVIWQIFEDRAGVLWFVTSNGLSRTNLNGNFYSYHEISRIVEDQVIGNQVKTILPGIDGNLWLGTQDGVIRLNDKSEEAVVFDANTNNDRQLLLNNVFALEQDDLGRIWIGSAGGINIWDDEKEQMVEITASKQNGLSSNYIAHFIKSPDGTFWVSAWEGGLFKVTGDLAKPVALHFDAVPGIDGVSEKIVYGDHAIWLIEMDQLYRVDEQTLLKELIPSFTETARNQMIYSLYYSKAGDVWAGTLNGLIQYNTKSQTSKFHKIITGTDVIISSIIEDSEGNIWSTTNTSTQKLTPSGEMIIFPLDKDLPLKSFYYGCASQSKDGHLLFGGDNGYISIDPFKALPNDYIPSTYITSLQINNSKINVGDSLNGHPVLNQDISFTNEIELDYDQRSITLEFSSLHYWQPNMNVYAYQLEGVDNDWKYVSGRKNFAVYSSLQPGSYTFNVKGSNNFGVLSNQIATLSITVHPPLLLSRTFIILYMILAAIATFFGLRFYSARVKLQNELKVAKLQKDHAEELEHTKEQFFTNISHELRTPISLILPPIHEIQQHGKLDDQSRKLIALAEKNSLRLLKLVNQILDFNKLESETLQLKLAQIELVSFSREVFDLFKDQATRHHISFEFKTQLESQTVWVDVEKVETILFNLLSNAFKFTQDGGEIILELYQDTSQFREGALVISVEDNGIGISAEDQKHIFDRFYQAEEGKRLDSSSGIGLTLAAEYVELHHGEITVHSAIGRGTQFKVMLPIGRSHLPVAETSDKPIQLTATRSIYPKTEVNKSYLLDLDTDKPTILLVEDNPDVIDFIITSLEEKYNFVTATNGAEGLEKANNFLPELIISDIMMPVMDGLEFCKRIKSNPKTSHITLILLTAKSLESNKLEGIRHGADVYLTKPFEIPLLDAHISNLIARKEELTNYIKTEFTTIHDTPDKQENRDTKFLKKVIDLIEVNISDPDFGVEEISKEVGMSSTHLYRKLKTQTGHSAQDIIKKYRVKKASLLLKNNEGNVSETMYKVGFSSASYFSKCFKAEFGITPKEYQKQKNP